MNREILFKAKRKNWRELSKEKQWVEGYYCKIDETTYCVEEDYKRFPVPTHHYILQETMTDWGLPNRFLQFEIDPTTLCQYAGLNDKNGKKIWENDIVKCKKNIDGNFVDYCIEVGYVEMKHGAFGLHRIKYNAYYRPFKDWLEDYEYEVVGNIFDNLEVE